MSVLAADTPTHQAAGFHGEGRSDAGRGSALPVLHGRAAPAGECTCPGDCDRDHPNE